VKHCSDTFLTEIAYYSAVPFIHRHPSCPDTYPPLWHYWNVG